MRQMTDEELEAARAEVRAEHQKMMEAALVLLDALHEADFRSVFLESMRIGDGMSGGFINLWLDEREVDPSRFARLLVVASEHGGRVGLGEPLGPGTPSRIRIWPRHD